MKRYSKYKITDLQVDTSLRQSIRLDLPGDHYFLTTFEESDAAALYECLSLDAVSDNLISVPKP